MLLEASCQKRHPLPCGENKGGMPLPRIRFPSPVFIKTWFKNNPRVYNPVTWIKQGRTEENRGQGSVIFKGGRSKVAEERGSFSDIDFQYNSSCLGHVFKELSKQPL